MALATSTLFAVAYGDDDLLKGERAVALTHRRQKKRFAVAIVLGRPLGLDACLVEDTRPVLWQC